MPKYEVQFIHVLERTVTAVVEADSEADAIEKAKQGEIIEDDDLEAPEEGLETRDYKVLGEYR